jgi:precorrin-3B methylase
MAGRLVVVGTGIRLVRQVTLEARSEIEKADKLLFLVTDPPLDDWLRQLNPTAESLSDCYEPGQFRALAYDRMVDRMLSPARNGLNVCVAFYGHPGVFVLPSHEAIRIARSEGIPAQMLPGISAEDCLFADLGIDPARSGCQSFEATDFLVSERRIDPRTSLILWQAGLVGRIEYPEGGFGDNRECLTVLRDVLISHYSPKHEVVIYEASPYVGIPPTIRVIPLSGLLDGGLTSLSTLYVPPVPFAVKEHMLKRLGLNRTDLRMFPPCWQGPPVSQGVL